MKTMKTTQISDIKEIETKEYDYCLNDENLSKSIVDFSLPISIRLQALDLFFKKEGADNTIETINKLGMMYELSNIKTLRQYLYAICERSNIGPFLQSIAAQSLCSHGDELGYEAINNIYPKLGLDVGTPYKIEMVKLLMKNPKYKDKASQYFCSIIDDMSLNCDYRYKTILSLETQKSLSSNIDYDYFIREASIIFVKSDKNLVRYKILASQNILKNSNNEEIEKIILNIAENEKEDYNTRADATDLLLQYGSTNTKNIAKQIIMKLGKIGKDGLLQGQGLYGNAQNVHTKEIEDSVSQALEFLASFEVMKNKGTTIDVDFVEKKIFNFIREEKLNISGDNKEKIKVSFNRIRMDRALYSKYNCTLSLILLKVWTYMTDHKHEKDMKKRLVEELIEMAETCSSGFATRLINSMSGFGDFSMRISWRDQIISNFSGRLNARARDLDDLTFQEKVLNEMTTESSKYEDRKHFLKFLRKNVLDIRGELYEEFKGYINDTDFDLYFRAALSVYENGSFI